MKQTILVAEDDDVAIRSLCRAIEKKLPSMKVVVARTFSEADAALKTFDHDFDAVVLDLLLPGGNGEELVPRAKKFQPGACIIVSSAYLDAALSCRLQLAGALTLPKPLPVSVLETALGGAPTHSWHAIGAFIRRCQLTNRQKQILMGVLDGKSIKQMATELAVSVSTVGEHIRRLLQKTGCKSRAALCKKVFSREGECSSDPSAQ